MNARIKKETKALAPAFGVTVGVTVAASLLWRGNSALGGGFFLFCVCCTLMGASCFGNEFNSRTMPLLLAQPVSRKKIWNEKMLVLGMAVFLAYTAWAASVKAFTDQESFGNDLWLKEVSLAVISAGVLCSTPWMTLKSRNTLIAALAAWMWPLSVVLGTIAAGSLLSLDQRLQDYFATHEAARQWLESHLHQFHPVLLAVAVALAYCAFAYCRGFAAFKNFQAAEPRQREIALPGPLQDLVSRPLGMLLPRYSSPLASLVRKEILLQRPAYVVAAALCAMALLEIVTLKLHASNYVEALLPVNIVVCVAILPMVVTGLSVAEERNLGLAAWHRTLPPPFHRQCLVKLAVVVGTCVLLGVILPCVMEAAGHASGLFSDGPRELSRQILRSAFLVKEAGCLSYLLMLMIGIFASSVSTTTFRAILLMLGLTCGIIALIALSNQFASWLANPFNNRFFNWQGGTRLPRPAMLGILNTELAIGLILLGTLAYQNYRIVEPTARRAWLQNGLVLMVTLALAIVFWLAVV